MRCSCCRQLQLQPAQQGTGVSQPHSPSALQLDLTQLDSSQPVPEPTTELQGWFVNEKQIEAPTLQEACHSITEPKPGVFTLLPDQSALAKTHPNDRNLTPKHSQPSPSSTYVEQPQHRKGSLSTGSYVHPHQMQHRGLSGFLTPLGKLAGMFGWTPGKPNEPLDRSQASQATSILSHVHPGRKELADLARPANLAIVSQELPASFLQVRPEQLTLQQLQDLQKAAELLSPRHASPIRSMAHSPSAAIISLGCQAKAQVSGADQSSLQQPTGPGMTDIKSTLDSQLRSPPANSPPAYSCGLGHDSSSGMAYAVQAAWDIDVLTQDDDDIVAALASKLALMAPHVSSLYTDMPHDASSLHNGDKEAGDVANQGQQGRQKRKYPEEAQQHQEGLGQEAHLDHAQLAETVAAPALSQAVPQQASDDACNKLSCVESMSDATRLVCSLGQNVQQDVLQQSSSKPPVHTRKRFRKTTGLEVLHRCMPSLWQQTGASREVHQ